MYDKQDKTPRQPSLTRRDSDAIRNSYFTSEQDGNVESSVERNGNKASSPAQFSMFQPAVPSIYTPELSSVAMASPASARLKNPNYRSLPRKSSAESGSFFVPDAVQSQTPSRGPFNPGSSGQDAASGASSTAYTVRRKPSGSNFATPPPGVGYY
jgi:hypothetical protein